MSAKVSWRSDDVAAMRNRRVGGFDEFQLDVYADIEDTHFWFHGRRRFIRHALKRELTRTRCASAPSAIDLGGGAGGWIKYLRAEMPGTFKELAFGDSSRRALELAGAIFGDDVPRYHVDVQSLNWQDRWDIVFLFDVIEHLPDDIKAVRQIALSLRPGGLLFVTAPALSCFWTYNDDLERHVRRYSRSELCHLADECSLEVVDARYFMFFLSPLLLLSRWCGPSAVQMAPDEKRKQYVKSHRVPPRLINRVLRSVFALETPIGHVVAFPWGTSVLGIFRKA